MIIFKIVGIAIVATIFIIVIKEEKPEMAFLLSMVTGLLILILVFDQIKLIIDLVMQLAEKGNIDLLYLNTIIKIVGIAYVGEFGAQITKDANESALAGKIEIATKILIMFLALPVMISLLEIVIDLIP